MRTKVLIGKLMAGLLFAISGQVMAAPVLCSAPGPHPQGLSTSDMTFNGVQASDCYGVVSGNDTSSNIGFAGFNFLVKDDDPGSGTDSGTVNGVTFKLKADDGDEGDWILSWSGALPVTMDLVAVLKGGNSFASYFFNNLTFTSSPSSGTGTFEINFTNRGGQTPDLSHLTLYWGDFKSNCCTNQIPEPSMLALLALVGSAMIGISRRRPRVTRR